MERKPKYQTSRILPSLSVDASTHSALMSVIDKTGESLAGIMNQMLFLGLTKYGMSPKKFRPDKRELGQVLERASERLKAYKPEQVTIKGFRIPAELAEDVRHEQGWRPLPEIMVEALTWWVERRRDMPMPPKPSPVKFSAAHKKRAAEYAERAAKGEEHPGPAILEWDEYPQEAIDKLARFEWLIKGCDEPPTPDSEETRGNATDSQEKRGNATDSQETRGSATQAPASEEDFA